MIIAHWLGRLNCAWVDSVVHAREKSKTYGIDRPRAIEPISGDKDNADTQPSRFSGEGQLQTVLRIAD
jgi:hypothetical protein